MIGTASLGGKLILLAVGIKCAFPLLHNWLQDAYPEATVTGTVLLSSFTTKVAVYALARGFAGTEALIYIGAVIAMYFLFRAVWPETDSFARWRPLSEEMPCHLRSISAFTCSRHMTTR